MLLCKDFAVELEELDEFESDDDELEADDDEFEADDDADP